MQSQATRGGYKATASVRIKNAVKSGALSPVEVSGVEASGATLLQKFLQIFIPWRVFNPYDILAECIGFAAALPGYWAMVNKNYNLSTQ